MDDDTIIADVAAGADAVIHVAAGAGLTQCELLCFIQGKEKMRKTMTDLIKLCLVIKAARILRVGQ